MAKVGIFRKLQLIRIRLQNSENLRLTFDLKKLDKLSYVDVRGSNAIHIEFFFDDDVQHKVAILCSKCDEKKYLDRYCLFKDLIFVKQVTGGF